ncbi:MAG: asparagine synthase (glutamine-hydrolyzing) [Candidatus Eisenbacteria bacterium]
MCGICGYLHADGRPVDESLGARMTALLRHRGPDGDGSLVVHPDAAARGPTLFLGHRRLKVIDLSEAARQPLANEDRSVWVMLNGEIYGFRSLRAELERHGHRFQSHSDTETIVHAYEQYGDDFVRHLDGQFALALWDAPRRRLVLARDRSGKKPLFHAFDGNTFTFGSEIKALLACPWVTCEVAVEHLGEYLTFGCVHGPATMFRGIHSLPPGTRLAIERGVPGEPVRYWDLRDAMVPRRDAPTEAEAAARVRKLLSDAVESRLISDVPLGALLSGGLDSTIVVGLMARLSATPVRTFTVGFPDEPTYDERTHAAVAARAFGTRHTEFMVRPDAASLMRRLLWHHDQPYGDSSAVPTYLVSKLARQHVTVALNGDGGDEVFGGYERFRAALMAERMPGFVEGLAGLVARALPRDDGYYGVRRRIERFVSRSGEPATERYLDWLSVFDRETLSGLLRPEIAAAGAPDGVRRVAAGPAPGADAPLLDRLLYLNFTTYLPDDLHVKVDRMSMAHALEPRSPMLDTALVEYVAGLPPDFKVRGSRLKGLLRAAFRDLVPPALLHRRKHGFGVPVDRWFAGGLHGMAVDLLLGPETRVRRWLDPEPVRRLLEEHVSGRGLHGHRLWTLVNLELWCRMLEEGSLVQPVSEDAGDAWEAQVVGGRG